MGIGQFIVHVITKFVVTRCVSGVRCVVGRGSLHSSPRLFTVGLTGEGKENETRNKKVAKVGRTTVRKKYGW